MYICAMCKCVHGCVCMGVVRVYASPCACVFACVYAYVCAYVCMQMRVYVGTSISVCACVLGVGMRRHRRQPSRSVLQVCRAAGIPAGGITACRADGGGVGDCVLPAPTIYPTVLPLLHQPLDSGPRYPRPAPELGAPQQQRQGSQGVESQSLGHPLPRPPAVRL